MGLDLILHSKPPRAIRCSWLRDFPYPDIFWEHPILQKDTLTPKRMGKWLREWETKNWAECVDAQTVEWIHELTGALRECVANNWKASWCY
jgi:hypothetical protein